MKCRSRQIPLLLALAGLTMAIAPQGAFAKGPADEEGAAKKSRKAAEVKWWNDSKIVSHLSLSEEQRKNMDDQFQAYVEKGPPPTDAAVRDAFVEALTARDWNGASTGLDEMAEAVTVRVRAQGDLKIHVLKQLSKEQHELLVEKYPQLLKRPWVNRRADSRPRRKSAGRSKSK